MVAGLCGAANPCGSVTWASGGTTVCCHLMKESTQARICTKRMPSSAWSTPKEGQRWK